MAETLRVRRADGEATYDRILEAAGELFADKGFAETTSKAIAARARVDVPSINYYFGSRNGLYLAVLIEARSRLISLQNLERIANADLPGPAKLKRLITAIVDTMMGKAKWHSQVVSREMLSPTSHWQSLEQTEAQPMLRLALGILADAASLPADDPALMPSFVCVAMACASLAQACRGPSTNSDVLTGMSHDAVVEHLYRFSMGGLEAIAKDTGGATGSP